HYIREIFPLTRDANAPEFRCGTPAFIQEIPDSPSPLEPVSRLRDIFREIGAIFVPTAEAQIRPSRLNQGSRTASPSGPFITQNKDRLLEIAQEAYCALKTMENSVPSETYTDKNNALRWTVEYALRATGLFIRILNGEGPYGIVETREKNMPAARYEMGEEIKLNTLVTDGFRDDSQNLRLKNVATLIIHELTHLINIKRYFPNSSQNDVMTFLSLQNEDVIVQISLTEEISANAVQNLVALALKMPVNPQTINGTFSRHFLEGGTRFAAIKSGVQALLRAEYQDWYPKIYSALSAEVNREKRMLRLTQSELPAGEMDQKAVQTVVLRRAQHVEGFLEAMNNGHPFPEEMDSLMGPESLNFSCTGAFNRGKQQDRLNGRSGAASGH
ncbi:MAG: hypothetical protein Q7S00_01255, partial [bacterium]|nr:hypothetical protein [bacterium]